MNTYFVQGHDSGPSVQEEVDFYDTIESNDSPTLVLATFVANRSMMLNINPEDIHVNNFYDVSSGPDDDDG